MTTLQIQAEYENTPEEWDCYKILAPENIEQPQVLLQKLYKQKDRDNALRTEIIERQRERSNLKRDTYSLLRKYRDSMMDINRVIGNLSTEFQISQLDQNHGSVSSQEMVYGSSSRIDKIANNIISNDNDPTTTTTTILESGELGYDIDPSEESQSSTSMQYNKVLDIVKEAVSSSLGTEAGQNLAEIVKRTLHNVASKNSKTSVDNVMSISKHPLPEKNTIENNRNDSMGKKITQDRTSSSDIIKPRHHHPQVGGKGPYNPNSHVTQESNANSDRKFLSPDNKEHSLLSIKKPKTLAATKTNDTIPIQPKMVNVKQERVEHLNHMHNHDNNGMESDGDLDMNGMAAAIERDIENYQNNIADEIASGRIIKKEMIKSEHVHGNNHFTQSDSEHDIYEDDNGNIHNINDNQFYDIHKVQEINQTMKEYVELVGEVNRAIKETQARNEDSIDKGLEILNNINNNNSNHANNNNTGNRKRKNNTKQSRSNSQALQPPAQKRRRLPRKPNISNTSKVDKTEGPATRTPTRKRRGVSKISTQVINPEFDYPIYDELIYGRLCRICLVEVSETNPNCNCVTYDKKTRSEIIKAREDYPELKYQGFFVSPSIERVYNRIIQQKRDASNRNIWYMWRTEIRRNLIESKNSNPTSSSDKTPNSLFTEDKSKVRSILEFIIKHESTYYEPYCIVCLDKFPDKGNRYHNLCATCKSWTQFATIWKSVKETTPSVTTIPTTSSTTEMASSS